jgi:hypothetical protein
MDIMLKAGRLRKKKFKVNKHTENLIKEVSSKYNIPEDKVVLLALQEYKANKKEGDEIEKLRRDIDALLEEMFSLEGKWASIRYKSHTLMKENRGLAIILSGYLGENKSLRNLMKKKNIHEDIEKVVDYYLWM